MKKYYDRFCACVRLFFAEGYIFIELKNKPNKKHDLSMDYNVSELDTINTLCTLHNIIIEQNNAVKTAQDIINNP